MKESKYIEGIHYESEKPVRLEINGGLICSITEIPEPEQYSYPYIAPGFLDNQINGYKGVDFSDPDLSADKMRLAVDAIRNDGVTGFFPTVITNSHENLLRIFRNLALTLEDDIVGNSVAGFHLEGPYISPEDGFYGCHPPAYIRKPSWKEFSKYQEAARGNIRQVTLAPEIEGAIEFIEMCARNNIVVAIGHTNASAEQIKRAADSGARLSTHLGNGCANLIDRHNNPLWPQLANNLIVPSIIADGHHLLPEEVLVFFKVKGPDNIILTSDLTHLAGLKPGRYMFFGSEVIFTDDGLIKNPLLNCLAGASFPILRGIENTMNFTGCSLGEAINLATRNVSRICKIADRGVFETGKRADLILFTKIDNNIIIKQVWVKGELVFS